MERGDEQSSDQRRPHRDVDGFAVADLANHDDVGVLPQQRAQTGGELHAGRRVHGDLHDPRDRVLDRILDRRDVDHVAALGTGPDEHGVERAGLAGAGRSGDQDHPVRAQDVAQQDLVAGGGQPEIFEVEQDRLLGQDAHHDLLAPVGGDRRDAQVDLHAAQVRLESPVLRRAPVVDPHAGPDLDAGHQRGQRGRRQTEHLLQHAVDAVAHQRFQLVRFDVDVGGARHGRILENPVDQLHRGAIVAPRHPAHDLSRRIEAGPLQHGPQIALVEQVGATNGRLRRQIRDDLAAGHPLDVVADVMIPRIPHRHPQEAIVEGEGHQDARARVLLGENAERLRLHVVEVDVVDAPRLGELRQKEAEGDAAPLDHRALEGNAQARGHAARLVEVGGVHDLQTAHEEAPELVLGDAEGRRHGRAAPAPEPGCASSASWILRTSSWAPRLLLTRYEAAPQSSAACMSP